jgi:PAS domain S-box-containing protein
MHNLRIGSLQWVVGAYCSILGAILLVAPHEFDVPLVTLFQTHTAIFGIGLLIAGAALFSVAILVPSRPATMAAHLCAGILLSIMGLVDGVAGSWLGAIDNLVLGLGTVFAGIIYLTEPAASPARYNLVTLLLGILSTLTGLLLLIVPAQAHPYLPQEIWGYLPFFGVLFMASAWLLFFVLLPFGSTGFSGRRWPGISWLAYLASGFIWVVFLWWGVLPAGSWAAVTFCGLVAFYLLVYPWLVHFAPFPFRTSLHARITLALSIAVAFPLILTVAWITYHDGADAKDKTVAHLQQETGSLAAGISSIVDLHRAGVVAMAQAPGMLTSDADSINSSITAFQGAFPDMRAMTVYDAAGDALASAKNAPVFPPNYDPLLERARQAQRLVGGLYTSSLTSQTVMGFGLPLRDKDGALRRVMTCYFGIDEIEIMLKSQPAGDRTAIALFDENGSAIVQPQADNSRFFQGDNRLPFLDSLFGSSAPTGWFDLDVPAGELLVGYASFPDLGWYLVGAEPVQTEFAGLETSRRVAFLLLVGCLSLAVGAGWWMGGRLTDSLGKLSQAASALAAGEPDAPLPHSSVNEIATLSQAFQTMRSRLASQSREQVQAESSLRLAKAELEVRVDERTRELREDLQERKQIEQTLNETRNRFHLVLDHSPVMVFTTDRNLRYTWVYHPWPGYSPEDLLHHRDDEILPEGWSEDLNALKQSVLDGGQGHRGEVRINTGVGIFSYDVALEPIFDDTGGICGLSGAAIDVTEKKRMEEEMRRSAEHIEVQRRLIEQRESERVQIARDLHDGPLQDLIGLNFLVSASIAESKDAATSQSLTSVSRSIGELIEALRAFAGELRPPALAKFGVARAMRSYAEEFEQKHTTMKIHLDLEEDAQTIPEPQRLVLFRIFQEALNNINRHARASQVNVRLQLASQRVILEIEDNGVGFTAPQDWLELARQGHLGLVGMRERAEAVKGNLILRSAPSEGTWIHVQLPLDFDDGSSVLPSRYSTGP